jgi:hypothetical protein
VLTRWN